MAPVQTPATLPALLRQFADEEVFTDWIGARRWSGGFQCPKCQGVEAIVYPGGVRRCKSCRARVSALSGTAVGEFRGPHDALLMASWAIAEGGTMSSSQLARSASVAYGSALLTMRKIRIGLLHAQDARAPELTGVVEADEAFVGGSKANTQKRGRSSVPAKHLVLCAVERGSSGRCVMRRGERATKVALRDFIKQYVQSGTTLHTDGWAGYVGIERDGYTHHPISIKGGALAAHEALPVVHQAISLLKRRMLATYNRQPDGKHLDGYLAEFCFRWNTRNLATAQRFEELWDDLLSSPHEVKR